VSWYSLLAIYQEAADIRRELETRPPLACPNDGEPLESGPDGSLHCKFDGWTDREVA
jgi:hypothetical protein